MTICLIFSHFSGFCLSSNWLASEQCQVSTNCMNSCLVPVNFRKHRDSSQSRFLFDIYPEMHFQISHIQNNDFSYDIFIDV